MFVNRTRELAALERWWNSPAARPALVWGRRRVGKTALLQEFARSRQHVFHTGVGRAEPAELATLSRAAANAVQPGIRDLTERPYTSWDDALEHLANEAREQPLLLVLDEFPELAAHAPELPGIMRAFLDRSHGRTGLRILVCGSAVRQMEALQAHREPLYGRFDLTLSLHPFTPDEASLMLPELRPEERAVVYGLLGGVPLYLSWWDQQASVKDNLLNLACLPGARLLSEGQLVLRTEAEPGDYPEVVLHALGAGKTRHNEIKDQLGTEPTRTLERLIQLRLVERILPVTETSRSRRRIYRVADNFLAFYLGIITRYRSEIERGLGESVLPVLMSELDDHLGGPWEEGFRAHLRTMASREEIGPGIVAIGPYWSDQGQDEIDAVALAGRARAPALVGEAKWARTISGPRVAAALRKKAEALPNADPEELDMILCAREQVRDAPPGVRTITAADVFAG